MMVKTFEVTMTDALSPALPVRGLYTVAEAAYIAEMEPKAVDREIDAHVVQPSRRGGQRNGRLLEKSALLYLAAVRDIRTMLDTKARAAISQRVSLAAAGKSAVVAFGRFQLPLKQLTRVLQPRLELIDEMREAFEVKPDVAGGELVVKGTRLKVHMLAEMIRRGVPPGEISREYELTKSVIRLVVLYDTLYPRRGRPPAPRHNVRSHPRFSG
jgi:uncharacterized protein (DUF433 family)